MYEVLYGVELLGRIVGSQRICLAKQRIFKLQRLWPTQIASKKIDLTVCTGARQIVTVNIMIRVGTVKLIH